jgi:hypothetical protein
VSVLSSVVSRTSSGVANTTVSIKKFGGMGTG